VKQLKRKVLKVNVDGFCSCHPVDCETPGFGEETRVKEMKI